MSTNRKVLGRYSKEAFCGSESRYKCRLNWKINLAVRLIDCWPPLEVGERVES